MSSNVADSLSTLTQVGEPVPVALSNELVRLLSEQLYQSPLKAVEELVVNAFDADASECRIYVPAPSEASDYIVVYDDGSGMSREGLSDLWQIGRSNKSENRAAESQKRRKKIGKFGIGKLATFTITQNLTYITKCQGQILTVTVDFNRFSASATGAGEEIYLPVRLIEDWNQFVTQSGLTDQLALACVDFQTLDQNDSWTLALLEGLKDKARRIKSGDLRWVLSTAMPLKADFQVFLNCQEISSSKETFDCPIQFDVTEIPKQRLDGLAGATGESWTTEDNKLIANSFPSGITGAVIVSEKTLFGGKSDDIARSHGFFVKVRDRLVNEEDALFGLNALFHGTFNRFRADIQADDLDQGITATRESIEESTLKNKFQSVLLELFNEANSRWGKHKKEEPDKSNPKREGERSTVSPYLVEYPTADAVSAQFGMNKGPEANESWFYLNPVSSTEVNSLVQSLYNEPRNKYKYEYQKNGSTGRLVKFDLPNSTFWINLDHELALAYSDEGATRSFLQDIVTAEAMLEVYLRESGVPPHVIGEVLEKRDFLLRGLARDHASSLEAISAALRDAAADEYELEIQLVVATRALGFVATHIAGADEPDGVARFTDYPDGEKIIILEAKSSENVPSLGAIDFAGLRRHVTDKGADGCLLVAPRYPGASREEDAAAARTAREQKISCWTVEQLAHFVSLAEKRHLNAQNVLSIVLSAFSPNEVSTAIDKMLTEPSWTNVSLYQAVLRAIRGLQGRLKDRPRTADMIASEVSREEDFTDINVSDVEEAIRKLASASQGGMAFRDDIIRVYVEHEELERRLQNLTKQPTNSRRVSQFRAK